MEPFASKLCVVTGDVSKGTDVDMSGAEAAGLFDIASSNVIYAKSVHERLNPASLTKVLTALCALKNSSLDEVLTASENVNISESGAVKLGLAPGDTMTMEQALHALLLKSANDVGVMIAEHVGGSVEGFAEMMNEMANSLGATNSHFVNPHGLTDAKYRARQGGRTDGNGRYESHNPIQYRPTDEGHCTRQSGRADGNG